MALPTLLIVGLKTLTLVLGGLITYFSLSAYHRTQTRSLGVLALGFGVVTFGALVAGLVDQLLAVSQSWAFVIESALTAVGFGIVLYSLYTR